MKTCTKCEIELPLWCFGKRGTKKDGSDWLRSECKQCRSAMDKNYNEKPEIADRKKKQTEEFVILSKKRNRDYVLNYLKKNPCVDCEESDPIVLQFDHVRGEKKRNISQMVARHAKLEVIKEEIKKCDVRCANCHARVTASRGGFWKTIH